MAMTIATLLGHLSENRASAIAPEIEKYGVGSGVAAHAIDCCIFQPIGMTREEWQAYPFYMFKPVTLDCWERRSAEILAWQKTIIPEQHRTVERQTPVTRTIRG